jgi:ATP-dependent helicase HrpB
VVSERHLLPPRTASTSSDLLSAVDEWRGMPWHVQRVATEIESIAAAALSPAPPGAGGSRRTAPLSELDFRRAVFSGYPDRVAERRDVRSPRLRLASGAGAVLGRESGVSEGEFLVAIDVQTHADGNAIVRLASRVEREWLDANGSELLHKLDRESGTVRATLVERYDALVLSERPVPPDEDVAARLLADEWIARGPGEEDQQLLRRIRFAGHRTDLGELARTAARGVRDLKSVRLERALPPDVLRSLDRDAPETIVVPSGRSVRLVYADDGSISASVKLQELFGLAETPRVGGRREPVILALLAPNGRPVQVTRDLQSFWNRTYPEVRKELRGRYPKHPWPEDPWNAPPTSRVKRSAPRGRR